MIQRYNENKNNDIQFNYRGQMNIFKWLDFNLSTTIQYTDSDHSGISASDITSLSPYDMLVNPDGSYTNLNFLKFYTPMIDAMVFKENFPYSDWSCCRVWWNKFCRKQNHRENKLGYHTSGLSG